MVGKRYVPKQACIDMSLKMWATVPHQYSVTNIRYQLNQSTVYYTILYSLMFVYILSKSLFNPNVISSKIFCERRQAWLIQSPIVQNDLL